MSTTKNADRILYLIKTRGPQMANQLAKVLDMTSMGARQHLTKLEAEGLLETFDNNENVGRPKRFWKITAQGQQRFPDTHADLSLNLIESTIEVFGEDGLNKLISHREEQSKRQYAAALLEIDSLRGKVEKLAEIRTAEGYMASVEVNDNNELLLIENHCPICAAATQCQNFCRSELAVFRHSLPDATVERTEHIVQGARRCCYIISA